MTEELESEETSLPETSPNTAPHDPAVPDEFARFMSVAWTPPSEQLPLRAEVADYTERRRHLLTAAFPGETLIVPTGTWKVRANDTDYVFRPGTDFFWLTGYKELDAVLVMTDTGHEVAATLYVAGRSDRSTSAFYRDRRYGELWVGPRKGVAETQGELGINCRPIDELPEALSKIEATEARVLRGFDDTVDNALAGNADRDQQLAQALSELRLIKDEYEIARLRDAIAATVVGFEEAARELGNAQSLERGERWIEGTFWRRARVDGNDVGYTSIVACGHHATTLHWVTNDGAVRSGDLALLDMGVESNELYTADVTRTLPINGKFSDAQRRVYDLVQKAQQAAFAEVKPGAKFLDPHRAAMKVIAETLEQWGVLTVSAEESLKPEVGHHRRYTLHGVSHMLGLDVHDCANASMEAYYEGELKPGMVLTVEPGLYFQLDDETAPPELRGIGVRIEDDVLVTEAGYENLSSALPADASDVEAWLADIRR